jgi:hypothetical protein
MNRQQKILKVGELLARFVAEVKIFTDSNLYDVNIHAENVLIPMLNEIFGLRFENMNATQKKNYPAIDLADFSNRIAFQITATSGITKINETLDTFKRHNLNSTFDSLYFFILSERQKTYSKGSIAKHLPDNFDFDPDKHIIDCSYILELVKNFPSIAKIDAIERVLTDEFSEIKIEQRRKRYEQKFLKATPENLYANLLKISFPESLYIADINIDKNAAKDRINEWIESIGGKQRKSFKFGKLFNNELRHHKIYFKDYILHEKKIITFRDLHKTNESLRKIIDVGTITELSCDEFYEQDENKLNVFKWLLRNTLIQFVHFKEMEWVYTDQIIRFQKDREAPRKKQKSWKGIKESTKTVIFEVLNKKLGHIICFRHLGFIPSFDLIEGQWYLILNPTWSFTNPYTSKSSRFEKYYMAGLKRLENNQTVYYFFRFFEYYLKYVDLFTTEYENLKISAVEPLSLSPSLADDKWKPIKLEDVSNLVEEGLEQDTELNPSLFD